MKGSGDPGNGPPTATRPRTAIGAGPVGVAGILILGLLLAGASLLALYSLWRFWPAAPSAAGISPATARFSYFGWHLSLPGYQQFFVIAAIAGALGGLLHSLRSLSSYVGERYLFRSWLLYYALLPVVGAILATLVYVLLRAGLLPGETASSQPNPYGIAAIAGLVGLFSGQAAEKLEAVFDLIFTKTGDVFESVRSLPEIALPAITGLDPGQGGPGTPVTISGNDLASVTGVMFGGADAASFTINSSRQVTAVVPAGAVTGAITLRAGQHEVTSEREFTVTA